MADFADRMPNNDAVALGLGILKKAAETVIATDQPDFLEVCTGNRSVQATDDG